MKQSRNFAAIIHNTPAASQSDNPSAPCLVYHRPVAGINKQTTGRGKLRICVHQLFFSEQKKSVLSVQELLLWQHEVVICAPKL